LPTWKQAPIVGANAFTHNAGLHVAAVLLDPAHYESIPADLVGRQRRLVVDKMAGRPTVRYRLEALGLPADDATVDAVLSYVKRRGINDAGDDGELVLPVHEPPNELLGFDAFLERGISYTTSHYVTMALEQYGMTCVNPHRVLVNCGDKALTSMLLARAGVPTPRTYLAFEEA